MGQNLAGANIKAKELVPIILSTVVRGPLLQRSQVCYHCDNSSVVAALSEGSAQNAIVMQLLHCIWFFITHHDIHIVYKHIAGSKNIAADPLSRNNLSSFSPLAHRLHRSPCHSC